MPAPAIKIIRSSGTSAPGIIRKKISGASVTVMMATKMMSALMASEITPRRIPPAEKLELWVRTHSIDARQVEVDFAGVDMNMGFNRATLDPIGPGEFAGPGMLPVCVRARMTWEARVLLHTDEGLAAAPFRFDTYLPGREPSSVTKEAGPE